MRLLESGQLLSIGANDGHCRSWKEAKLPFLDVDKLPHSSAPLNKLLTSIASFDKCWKTIGIPFEQWLPNPKVDQKTIKLNSCSQPFQKMAMFAFKLSKIRSGRKHLT